ncbi:MAG: hypothetical protein BGO49_22185 [Planctomycetales bacterium 71-10]|nr:MAG: hypothetical protein BGO49_22185 [Planctomycetales bacterium 71-10]
MRAWLAEPRTALIAAVAEGVRAHVASLRAEGRDIHGYALLPGEYYDINGLTAVVRTEAPPAAPEYGTERFYRYCVDEWDRWEHSRFLTADAILAALNERFRSLHSKPDEFCVMDEFEIAHADSLLDAVASGLEAARDAGAFGDPAPFLAV